MRKQESKPRPVSSPKQDRVHEWEYDAHIYFTEQTEPTAEALRSKLLSQTTLADLRIGPLIRRKIGPHPQPMFEVNFKKEALMAVISWLESNRGDHEILIHPVTGDDLLDHTTHAKWLGNPLLLDLKKL